MEQGFTQAWLIAFFSHYSETRLHQFYIFVYYFQRSNCKLKNNKLETGVNMIDELLEITMPEEIHNSVNTQTHVIHAKITHIAAYGISSLATCDWFSDTVTHNTYGVDLCEPVTIRIPIGASEISQSLS